PTGKEPRDDGAVDVDGLRPISVECALWRLVASTFCRRESVRQWALSWAPREFYGALQGVDCEALAAMDLAKAFDNLSLQMLTHLGLPRQMGRALCVIWGQQQRWLRWSRWSTAGPERVCSSVLQGDALAPVAMLACLVSPTRAIAREHPEVQQTIFVDDRALTARRAQVEDVRRHGWGDHLKNVVRVLGVDFTRIRTSSDRQCLHERWQEALRIAKMIALLGVSVAVRPAQVLSCSVHAEGLLGMDFALADSAHDQADALCVQ
ncbi:unnamed protein product, partial [Symbiodinium sp. KB8]